ncbi:MAG TPA: sigma 54-interacting transcriptional regulator [Paraburkholderia sp.]|uniref:sigma-54 interaction domain-containing protein n=1 Tax=Paraburkholderia sp. TaxID=1926495 RepID=UPI002BDFE746|nr:sigma 54-interacting transcriptional regulator [Paraburkholderia sp.]HTR05951.1 sigma 54-interacting transcriptional regulator [Paraburkholderia sp.]
MELESTALLADYDYVKRLAMQTLFATLENFSEGTVIVDRNARVVWINQHYAARFGYDDPQAAIGLDCEAVIPNSMMREVVQGGEPILLDILETDRDPIVVTRLPIKDDVGQTIGAVGFVLFNEIKGLSPLFSQYARLRAELISTRQSLAQVRRAKYSFASLIGTSAVSLEVKRQARRAARLASPVLLLGETGTGKELLAHAIHGASGRADGPLVTVNVAAIPDTLLELEFFGAEAGAYTGADRNGRIGKFELANGGTLFLDEIGDMPLALQGKLLRVLQEQEFEPLGTNRIVRVDVRIVAATSADLPELVAQGKFRADLYYRLNVLTIRVPPLRERLADIEAMAYAMLDKLSVESGAGHLELDREALALLCSYAWPGNVRELRNTLERAVLLSEGERIDASSLARFIGDGKGEWRAGGSGQAPTREREAHAPALAGAGQAANYDEAMRDFERRFLSDALRAADGHVAQAAERIGMARATLYRRIAALGIEI